MKNDVRDWLPSSYDETGELLWFKDHFLGEQFVVVSWEKLYGGADDQKFSWFVNKLLPSLSPSEIRAQLPAAAPPRVEMEESEESEFAPEPEAIEIPTEVVNPLFHQVLTKAEVDIERPNFIGDDLRPVHHYRCPRRAHLLHELGRAR